MTCGIAPLAAVTVYSVEGLAGLGGRLALGVLADRLGVKRVLIAGLLIQALAAGAFIFAVAARRVLRRRRGVRLRLRRRDAALRGAGARVLRPAHPRRGVRRRGHGVEPRHGARAAGVGGWIFDTLRPLHAGCTSARPRSASAPWRSRWPSRRCAGRQRQPTRRLVRAQHVVCLKRDGAVGAAAAPPAQQTIIGSMKVLVPVKRVVDFNVKVRVKSDGIGRRHRQRQDDDEPVRRDRRRRGGAPEGEGRRRPRSSPSPAASPQCQETLRTALAIGADRAHPGRDRRRAAAAGGGQAAEGAGRQGSSRSS